MRHINGFNITEIGIIRELQDQHIMEKRIAEFAVEVDNDSVTGFWTKNGVKLQPSEKNQVSSRFCCCLFDHAY